LKPIVIIGLFFTSFVFAEEQLETIKVTSEKQTISEFWEENQASSIFSGKKNTVTSLKEIPQLPTNNYRQATSQTPGLLISEIPNEALAAITFRGLGDPHESFNVLLLQDGLPVPADMYGYPAHYFSPALPMMEKVQFTRGGASLLYGPQPGGVLNYMSNPLKKNQPSTGKVGITLGSYNLLTTNNAVFGSKGDSSYALEYYRRQGDGPQQVNSDFAADYLQARQHFFKDDNVYKVSFNGYNSDHGSPGGFSKTGEPGSNQYGDDQDEATKRHDRLKVSRAQLAGGLEKRIDDKSTLQVNLWATAYRRYSKSQNQGGGSTFGRFPTGTTNNIVTQQYYGYNGEARYLKNYSEHTFSAGYLSYNLLSPYTSETGTKPDSNHGDVTRRLDRTTHVNSFFAENRFAFGDFMITPGARLENIRQTIDERKNTVNNGNREEDATTNVPLFGLGMTYYLNDESQIYSNISESYKPVTYQESVPLTNTSTTISEDIAPSKILTYEIGYRAKTEKIIVDASIFYIRYENKFGAVGDSYQNTGAGTNKGFDLATELKLSEFSSKLKTKGEFNLYGNIEVLDARFTKSSPSAAVDLQDKTPQYAPKTITRTGLIYKKEDRLKAALMGVMVSRHYGDDANTDNFEIPPYMIWDLTAEWNVTKNWIASAGINNLLDKQYYSRVRGEGIIWALGRNIYLGASYQF
jgi:Fe(3+) dicitrate transport protein